MRSPEDFHRNHFDGGRNHNSRDRGPVLIDLLTLLNRSFFDGRIKCDVKLNIASVFFQVCCPFTTENMSGRYAVNISINKIEETLPFRIDTSLFMNFILGEPYGSYKTIENNRFYYGELTVITDQEGKIAFEVTADKRHNYGHFFVCASETQDPKSFAIPDSKYHMVRPVMSQPTCLIRP